jgi:TrmH family RNA methyltransferase
LRLTSAQNPLIKEIRRAVQKGGLTSDGYAIAEGIHVVNEAIHSGCEIGAVIAAESFPEAEPRFAGLKVVRLPEALFAGISSTETPQGVMALVRPPEWTVTDLIGENALILILDGIQEPGNAGAAVRSAEAFGASGVLFLRGSVSAYNPKAIRGSAGSVFRLPIVSGMQQEIALERLTSHGIRIYAAMPDATASLDSVDLTHACAFVIGNEGRGVADAISTSSWHIRIPTQKVESLNAAVAAAILIYEARRQRTRNA